MEKKGLFIAPLYNLEITGTLGSGERIISDLRITNDRTTVKELLHAEFALAIGGLELEGLLESKAVVYCFFEADPDLSDDDRQMKLVTYLYAVEAFLHFLWIIKDNSINCELGFLELPHKIPNSRVSSNSIVNRFTFARGGVNISKFSRAELKRARQLFRENHLHIAPELPDEEVFSERKTTPFVKGMTRLNRAFYFLESARKAIDVGYKISQYCSCFETLFLNDSQELSHKIAERVAWIISKDFDERREVFRLVKRSYEYRSRVIHGSYFKPTDLEKVREIAVETDSTLRRIFYKIMTDKDFRDVFESSNEKFDDFFLNTILGRNAGT